MIIADTSAWINFLRNAQGESSAPLRAAMNEGRLVLCEPVHAEIMAGAREHEMGWTERTLAAFTLIPTERSDWENAATVKRMASRRGRTVPDLIDCLIAGIAIHHDATVLHDDSDFELIAEVFPMLDQTRG